MGNIGWGLWMMLLGMATVFVMLIVLMIVLMLLGKFDRPPVEAKKIEEAPVAPEVEAEAQPESIDENAWMTTADASGMTPEQLAAVSVAVATHADVLRKQGALANRVYAPGSRIWASRWVGMGRNSQMSNTRRR